jgi:hypothetical protein
LIYGVYLSVFLSFCIEVDFFLFHISLFPNLWLNLPSIEDMSTMSHEYYVSANSDIAYRLQSLSI